jgi:hypothetical protein
MLVVAEWLTVTKFVAGSMNFASVDGPHERAVFAATVCDACVPVLPAGVRPGSTIVTPPGVAAQMTVRIAPALMSLPLIVSLLVTAAGVERVPAVG